MTRLRFSVLFCLLLSACQQPEKIAAPAAPAPADPTQLTVAEKKRITDEILRNWDLEVLKGCPWGQMAPVQLLISLSPDAAVTSIERSVPTDDAACTRTAYESAEQAVRVSSPLDLPPGKQFATLRLKLIPQHVVW
jgi:hypothetical protein